MPKDRGESIMLVVILYSRLHLQFICLNLFKLLELGDRLRE